MGSEPLYPHGIGAYVGHVNKAILSVEPG